jgi:hypothetical protein
MSFAGPRKLDNWALLEERGYDPEHIMGVAMMSG